MSSWSLNVADPLYMEPSERLVALFRDVYKDGPFRAIYDGDPDRIPASNLPAICVVQQADTNSESDNMSDQVDCEVQIRVVFNKRDDWGRGSQQPKQLTDEKIRRIVEERDPATGRYVPDSIKGAIRTRLELDPASWVRRDMRFEIGSVLRTTGTDDLVTREGVLTVTVVYPVDIPDMT